MFEQVTLFLSFIYAIAVTHLLSSATELVLARDRVRVSGVLIGWMVCAFLLLVTNWLSSASLAGLQHWTLGEALIQFSAAIVQYFTCSLVSMRVERHGEVDMVAFFERNRPLIAAAFLTLGGFALLQNYLDRATDPGGPQTWIRQDLQIAPLELVMLLAMFVRARWVQWVAITVLTGGIVVFMIRFVAAG